MDSNHPDKIMAFDALFTTNYIRILKLLLEYLEPPLQGQLAVYIKFMELRYTLSLFYNNPFASIPPYAGCVRGGLDELLEDILPYCSSEERDTLRNIQNMLYNFKNMQEMMETFQMLQEVSPELFSSFGDTDMSQMMEMMQEMFNAGNNDK